MIDDVQNTWEKFLNPEELKPYLLFCSIFITSYELLKETIIERLVVFFSDEFDKNGHITGMEYEKEVLALDEKRNILRSSLAWHLKNNIIDSDDMQSFNRITNCRNDLTHRMLKNLTEAPI